MQVRSAFFSFRLVERGVILYKQIEAVFWHSYTDHEYGALMTKNICHSQIGSSIMHNTYSYIHTSYIIWRSGISFRDFPPDSIPRVVASSRQRGGGSHEHDTHHIYTLFFQMPISFTSSFEPPLNIIGIYVERSLLRDFGCTFTMKTVWIRFQTFAALPGLVVCFALFRKGLSSSPLL